MEGEGGSKEKKKGSHAPCGRRSRKKEEMTLRTYTETHTQASKNNEGKGLLICFYKYIRRRVRKEGGECVCVSSQRIASSLRDSLRHLQFKNKLTSVVLTWMRDDDLLNQLGRQASHL